MQIDVSIIMPLYKNALSLRRSLDSILNQDYQGTYEVILCVDDSGDGTLDICKEYAEKYKDIFILHHPSYHMGVSGARKEGQALARGKYIYAVDGDDELKENCLSTLVKAIEEHDCDMVNCSFYTTKIDKNHAKPNPFHGKRRIYNQEEAFYYFLNDISFRGFLWTKMYKAELLKKHPQIFMPGQGVIFEDVAFVAGLLSHCNKVMNLPEPLYYYYKDNPNSEVTRPRKDRALWHLAIWATIRMLLEKLELKGCLNSFFKRKFRSKLSLNFDISCDKKGGITKPEIKALKACFKRLFSKAPVSYKEEMYGERIEGAIVE